MPNNQRFFQVNIFQGRRETKYFAVDNIRLDVGNPPMTKMISSRKIEDLQYEFNNHFTL